MNLSAEIEVRLPAAVRSVIKAVEKLAAAYGQQLYLVGGVVRDVLLNRETTDLDLATEGDAISIARELAKGKPVKLTTHSRFNTAALKWQGFNVDIATTRSETYIQPGALPAVKPDSIIKDLSRRDFTINAMAVCLAPDRYGELIDLYGGIDDLNHRIIRVLHEQSFTDDATRIWRAIRYEQRLGFNIEPQTLGWLKRDIRMLETVTGDRIRNELELVMLEQQPEKALERAFKMGALTGIHRSLTVDRRLTASLSRLREETAPGFPSIEMGFALLVDRLTDNDIKEMVSYLKIPGKTAQVMQDMGSIKDMEPELAEAELKPSRIYRLLHGFETAALAAAAVATESVAVRSNIRLYLDKLRNTRTILNGSNLLQLGVPEGPAIKEILLQLLYARLDGQVKGRKEEEELVRKLTG